MARPSRRVLIGLSIKLGISPREIEQWPMDDVRDCVAYLMDRKKPEEPKPFDEAEFERQFNAQCR